MNPTDDVNVQLTAAGLAAANGGKLAVHGGGGEIVFEGATAVPVSRAVWLALLLPTAPFGKPFFQLAPESPAPGKPVVVPPAKTSAPSEPSASK